MGSAKKPRFEQSLFRTADEQFQYAQNSLGPAFGRALELQQKYGPGLLSQVRAGAPEQTAFALSELESAEQGQLAPGQQRAYMEAFRGAETSRLGALGARQPQGAFSEALGTAELLRNRQLQALGMLRTTEGTEFFERSVPDLNTALTLEQQRGANLQAMLNARAQAKSAASQRNFQMLTAGAALAAAPFTGGATLPLAFGAIGGAGGFQVPSMPTFNFGQTGQGVGTGQAQGTAKATGGYNQSQFAV